MKSVFLALLFFIQALEAYRVICVYTNWAQYRPDGGKFMPEDVDAGLCTHLIYVYAKLKGNRLAASEWNDESSAWSEGMFERVNNLKQINPELKTLLGVGGWMMGSKEFSKLAAGRTARKVFATSTVKYLRDKNFDGLAIDWQHPTKRGGKPHDKVNYSLLLKELRMAFEEESKNSGMPTLLLVTGVSASREIIDDAYEIDNMTKYTDFLNVMAYDLHGSWDNYTGHPSQLYPRENEFGPSTEINVDAAMRYWMSHVPDRSKLVLGVSTYGRTFTLRKARHNDYNVPTSGPGVAGEFTQQPGMLAYYERCSQYADANRVWDEASQVAYWYSGDQWIAAEDIDSIKAKVNWTRTYDIGGLMVWSLDTDDFGAKCIGEKYKVLNNIVRELNDPTFVKRNISISKITTKVVVPTTEMVTTFDTTTMEHTFETTESTWSTDLTTYEVITESTTQISTIGPKKLVKAKLKIKTNAKQIKEDEAVILKNLTENQTIEKNKTEQQTEKPPLKEDKSLRNQVQQSTKRKRRKMKRRRLTPEQHQTLRRKVAGRRPIKTLRHETKQQGEIVSKPTRVANNDSHTNSDLPETNTKRTGGENEQANAHLQNGFKGKEITLSKRIKVTRKRQPEAIMTPKDKEQEQVASTPPIVKSDSSKSEQPQQQDSNTVSLKIQVNDTLEKSLVTISPTPSTNRLTSPILEPTTQKMTPKETTTATPLTQENNVNQEKNDSNGRTKMRRRRKQKHSNVDQQANEAI